MDGGGVEWGGMEWGGADMQFELASNSNFAHHFSVNIVISLAERPALTLSL